MLCSYNRFQINFKISSFTTDTQPAADWTDWAVLIILKENAVFLSLPTTVEPCVVDALPPPTAVLLAGSGVLVTLLYPPYDAGRGSAGSTAALTHLGPAGRVRLGPAGLALPGSVNHTFCRPSLYVDHQHRSPQTGPHGLG